MTRSGKSRTTAANGDGPLVAVARTVTALEAVGSSERAWLADLDSAVRRLATIADASGLLATDELAALRDLLAALDRQTDAATCDALIARHERDLPEPIAGGLAEIAESVGADLLNAEDDVRRAASALSTGTVLREIAGEAPRISASAVASAGELRERATVRRGAAIDAFIARLDELAAGGHGSAAGAAYLSGALRVDREALGSGPASAAVA